MSESDPYRDSTKQIVCGTYLTNRGKLVNVFDRQGRFAFFTFDTQVGTNQAELRRIWPTEKFYISRHHWFEADGLQDPDQNA